MESQSSDSKLDLKVIGAGLWRTGSSSLRDALIQLGYGKCYHMKEAYINESQGQYWKKLEDGSEIDFENLLEGYHSFTDVPMVLFIEQILKKNPNVKVILNTRDPNSWYESSLETVFKSMVIPKPPHVQPVFNFLCSQIKDINDKEECIAYFHKHEEHIRSIVPKENLLDGYQVKQGWKPLCEFLGVPEPDTPFPVVNDREEFKARLTQNSDKEKKN